MVKRYIYLYGVEGSHFGSLKFIPGTLPELKKNFIGAHFNNGYTLGWIIDQKHIEPFAKGEGYDLPAFFQSLKLSDRRRFNYSCRKIHGFCDIIAPARNSGILKRWYDKWKTRV